MYSFFCISSNNKGLQDSQYLLFATTFEYWETSYHFTFGEADWFYHSQEADRSDPVNY